MSKGYPVYIKCIKICISAFLQWDSKKMLNILLIFG